jgi:hypothetical protein
MLFGIDPFYSLVLSVVFMDQKTLWFRQQSIASDGFTEWKRVFMTIIIYDWRALNLAALNPTPRAMATQFSVHIFSLSSSITHGFQGAWVGVPGLVKGSPASRSRGFKLAKLGVLSKMCQSRWKLFVVSDDRTAGNRQPGFDKGTISRDLEHW